MKRADKLKSYLFLSAPVVLIVVVFWRYGANPSTVPLDDIVVPELSAAARTGQVAFDENCATCHGATGSGTDKGPPLVHDIYNPGHHADAAFHLAVRRGVPRHHWRFGSMPPQQHVTEQQVAAIVAYIRELQAANGTTYRRHQM